MQNQLEPIRVKFFAEFLDYFGQFLTQIAGAIYCCRYCPPRFESKIGSKEPKNRLKLFTRIGSYIDNLPAIIVLYKSKKSFQSLHIQHINQLIIDEKNRKLTLLFKHAVHRDQILKELNRSICPFGKITSLAEKENLSLKCFT